MKRFMSVSLSLSLLMTGISLSACAEQKVSESQVQQESDFTFEEKNGGLILTGWKGTEAELQIPSEINGKAVTEVGESCFAGNIGLKIIRLPEGITAIGDYAFECCSGLEKIYFPSTLASVGEGAFSGCASLTVADMQEGIEKIGRGAFLYCTSLVYAELPSSLKEIGRFAFAGCHDLAAVKFRGSLVDTLPDRVFLGCTNLKRINIPESVVSIGRRALSHCESLTALYFPSKLENLSGYAFEGCSSLTSLDFSAARIEDHTFTGCGNLQNLTVSSEAEVISAGAFSDSNISSVSLSGNTKVEEGAFASSGVKSVDLREEGSYVLKDGSLFTKDGKTILAYFPADPYAEEPAEEYTVPEGTEVIGAYAFFETGLTKVNLPASVKEIHAYAFSGIPAEGVEIPEGANTDPNAFGSETADPVQSEPAEETQTEMKPGSYAGDKSLFDEEKYAGFREIKNDEFEAWSEDYLAANKDMVISSDLMPYIIMYKGEVIPHYMGMTSVQNHDPQMTASAVSQFGDDYEEMYLMMDHGLFTELKRGRMTEDLILYSGVYDSQLMAAAGTDTVPDQDQLTAAVGTVFTDPIMISTTTDIGIACNFSDTLFIIYASKEAMEQLGAVSIDSLLHTQEKEILMNAGAQYKVLDHGVISVDTEENGEAKTVYRKYVKVELLCPGEHAS